MISSSWKLTSAILNKFRLVRSSEFERKGCTQWSYILQWNNKRIEQILLGIYMCWIMSFRCRCEGFEQWNRHVYKMYKKAVTTHKLPCGKLPEHSLRPITKTSRENVNTLISWQADSNDGNLWTRCRRIPSWHKEADICSVQKNLV